MLVFAHRGASASAPENTLKAFELALQQGADGIELDVYQHGDEFLIIHDQWLDRTTNGRGNIKDYSFDELRKLDAGDGQCIPTLKEAIDIVKEQCELNIEVKGVRDTQALIDYVNEHSPSPDKVIYSSFDHHILGQIQRCHANARLGALTACKPLQYAEFAQQLGAESVNADAGFLDQNFIADAKQRGLKVFAYTVDQEDQIRQFVKWGVDGIFSNGPGRALAIAKASA